MSGNSNSGPGKNPRRNAMIIEELRNRIRAAELLNRLQDHALGDIEMSPTQLKAAEVLLKKRIPDLQSTQIIAELQVQHQHKSDAERAAEAVSLIDETFGLVMGGSPGTETVQ